MLRKKLWALTSKIVRLNSDHCYTCGKYLEFKDRQAGHFFTKGGHPNLRYDFRNLRVQCVACNLFKSGNLAEYSMRLERDLGSVAFQKLGEEAHKAVRHDRGFLESAIQQYEIILKNYENNVNSN